MVSFSCTLATFLLPTLFSLLSSCLPWPLLFDSCDISVPLFHSCAFQRDFTSLVFVWHRWAKHKDLFTSICVLETPLITRDAKSNFGVSPGCALYRWGSICRITQNLEYFSLAVVWIQMNYGSFLLTVFSYFYLKCIVLTLGRSPTLNISSIFRN